MNGNFEAFPADLVQFLRELKQNNDRDWFNANKERYETAFRQPAGQFASTVCDAVLEMTGTSHDAKVFRIHRDVRFSKDKTPYNTHLHVSFLPDGEMATKPAFFFGVDTEKATVGAGCFGLEKAALDRFRERVAGPEGEALAAELDGMRPAGVRFPDPELKKVPAPYTADHPRAELLRRKSLSAWRDLGTPETVTQPGLVAAITRGFEQVRPVYDFMIRNG